MYTIYTGIKHFQRIWHNRLFFNSYKNQEIAHIYLQDNLFGVMHIVFTTRGSIYIWFMIIRLRSIDIFIIYNWSTALRY
jgi:hypothetical protein